MAQQPPIINCITYKHNNFFSYRLMCSYRNTPPKHINPLGFDCTLSTFLSTFFLSHRSSCPPSPPFCFRSPAPMGRCWDDKKQTVWKVGRGRKRVGERSGGGLQFFSFYFYFQMFVGQNMVQCMHVNITQHFMTLLNMCACPVVGVREHSRIGTVTGMGTARWNFSWISTDVLGIWCRIMLYNYRPYILMVYFFFLDFYRL